MSSPSHVPDLNGRWTLAALLAWHTAECHWRLSESSPLRDDSESVGDCSTTELVPGVGADAQELTDVHIFAEARDVVEALHAHDCGPALAWCGANKPKLKKIRSSLEFQLRVQVRSRRGSSCNPVVSCEGSQSNAKLSGSRPRQRRKVLTWGPGNIALRAAQRR